MASSSKYPAILGFGFQVARIGHYSLCGRLLGERKQGLSMPLTIADHIGLFIIDIDLSMIVDHRQTFGFLQVCLGQAKWELALIENEGVVSGPAVILDQEAIFKAPEVLGWT